MEVVDGDNTTKQHTLETPGNIVEDTVPKMDASSSTSEDEETLAKTDTCISVTDQVAADVHKVDVPVEEIDNVGDNKPVLRAEAAEFVPVSPESERPSKSFLFMLLWSKIVFLVFCTCQYKIKQSV